MKTNLLFITFQFTTLFLTGCNSDHLKEEKQKVKTTIEDIRNGEVYKNLSIEDLSIITAKLYNRSKEIEYEEGILGALGIMSENEISRGNTEACIRFASEGIVLAKKLNDYDVRSSLLCVKGLALLDQGYFDEGKQSLEQAISLTEKIKTANSRHLQRVQIFTAFIDFFDGRHPNYPVQPDSIEMYYQMAINEGKNINQSSLLYNRNLINNKYLLALKILDCKSVSSRNSSLSNAYVIVEEGVSVALSKNYKELVAIGLLLKGVIKSEMNVPEEALSFYLQAEPIIRYFGFYYELNTTLNLLSNTYRDIGDYKSESYYLSMARSLKDSLNDQEIKAIQHHTVLNNDSEFSSFSLLSVYITFTVLGIFFIISKRKNKIVNVKVCMINSQVKELDSNAEKLDISKLKEVVEFAKNNSELFYLSFLEQYPDFNKKLLAVNAQFTTSDIEFCAFLKLNFDTKEIARYRNISIRSVDSKKYRIRKKLGLSKDEDTYAYFLEF